MSIAAYDERAVRDLVGCWTAEWPPSNNGLYPDRQSRRILSGAAVAWRDTFLVQMRQRRSEIRPTPENAQKTILDDLRGNAEGVFGVVLTLYPPDRGRHDLNNVDKLLIDTLSTELGFDDNRIVELRITKMEPWPPGCILVKLFAFRPVS